MKVRVWEIGLKLFLKVFGILELNKAYGLSSNKP